LLIVGVAGLSQKFPLPGQQFVQSRCWKIGDTGEDVSEPGLGIDVIETTSRDDRQHDGGSVGATLAAGEGPVAPSQGDASQCAFSAIVGQADPAVVEETGEVIIGQKHLFDDFYDPQRSLWRDFCGRNMWLTALRSGSTGSRVQRDNFALYENQQPGDTLSIERHDEGYLAYFPALSGCHTRGNLTKLPSVMLRRHSTSEPWPLIAIRFRMIVSV